MISIKKDLKIIFGGLAGKESACNVGDLGLIPKLGRSPAEGNGYPLHYSGLENSLDYSMGSQRVGHNWATFTFSLSHHIFLTMAALWSFIDIWYYLASQVARWKRICLPMQKMQMWVQSLGWEDTLGWEMAIYSNILAWKIWWTEEPSRPQSMGLQRVKHDWATEHAWMILLILFMLIWNIPRGQQQSHWTLVLQDPEFIPSAQTVTLQTKKWPKSKIPNIIKFSITVLFFFIAFIITTI